MRSRPVTPKPTRWPAAIPIFVVLGTWMVPMAVLAQAEAPPVPPGPAAEVPAAPAEDAPAPGFNEDEEAPPPDEAPAPRVRRAQPRREDEAPIDVPEPGNNERLIEQINATRGEITLAELMDEILADVVAELDRRSAKVLSPMAIRDLSVSANVASGFSRKLRSMIIAQIHSGTRIVMKRCIECEATRSRIVGGQLVITRGLVTTDELREVGERIGVKTFLDVAFAFDPDVGRIEMHFSVVRAEDAQIIWADTFRADETTPMLLRSSEAPVRRKDRLRDLEMLLEGRPYYGYMASAGFALLPYDHMDGDITGATAGYRIYERFGEDRRVMFGLDLMGFLNTTRLAGAILSAGSWWIPIRPDLTNPELRLGAKAGAFVAGSEGNAAVFQLGAEVLLRYRFGLYGYVLIMTKSEFNGAFLGGVGFTTGLSFNW